MEGSNPDYDDFSIAYLKDELYIMYKRAKNHRMRS